jgi:hypothetical protein
MAESTKCFNELIGGIMTDCETVILIGLLLFIPLTIFYALGSWYASYTENEKTLKRMREGKWDVD